MCSLCIPSTPPAAKLVATAHSRVDKRMGWRLSDRGSKDINTVVALLRGGHIDLDQVITRLDEINLLPSYIAELSSVIIEVRTQVAATH